MKQNFTLLMARIVCVAALVESGANAQTILPTYVTKLGQDFDVRSGARILADEVLSGNIILPDASSPVPGGSSVPQIQLRGGNVQVNSPAFDSIQIFPGFRPFIHSTQSETSGAAFGQHVVVTYNSSAGAHVSQITSGLVIDQFRFSAYSVSNDGGQTWRSGFMPPAKGAIDTFGDPTVDVDRHGNFYFAGLGSDVAGRSTIQVNASTDGGNTWSDAVIVQQDDGADKEWLAVGPDPANHNRDNVYVTWTSFQTACELRFASSIDGGKTWSAKTIFVPTQGSKLTDPTNCLQSSNPTVDPITGSLYIPFLRYSNADQDFIQMLISDDAGKTFRFASFNMPGAPSATLLPVTQPGDFIECGATRLSATLFSVNLRLTIHSGPNIRGSITGLPRYVNASRLLLQPSLAARNGVLYMAWNNSTSLVFGDPSAHSNVLFMKSPDAGRTWTAPITVNPSVAADIQHVMPSLALDKDPDDVHVTYYTQHANGSIDLDMANSHNGGVNFPQDRTVRVSSISADLPPTNIPIPSASNPFATTNYDRLVQQCYALGEYQSVVTANGSVYASWGDSRNTITEPAGSPIAGQTHPQEDIIFQMVKAQ